MKSIKVYTKTNIITINEDGHVKTENHSNPRKLSGIYVEYADISFKVKK